MENGVAYATEDSFDEGHYDCLVEGIVDSSEDVFGEGEYDSSVEGFVDGEDAGLKYSLFDGLVVFEEMVH